MRERVRIRTNFLSLKLGAESVPSERDKKKKKNRTAKPRAKNDDLKRAPSDYLSRTCVSDAIH